MADYQEGHFHAQDGLRLYYRDYTANSLPGSQPVILCLGGLARNSKDFHRIAGRLSNLGCRVICPDYRGRGRSEYSNDPMTYQATTYLDDIRHLLTALNIHQVVVLGTSLGGLLAMGMGAAMPTTLAGAILNDVGPDIAPGGMSRIIDYLSNPPELNNWDDAVATIKEMFALTGFTEKEQWQRLAENTFREDDDGIIRYDWDPNIVVPLKKKTPLPDLWALFRSLKHIPVLAFRGEKSDILTTDTFDNMKTTNPNMIAVEVPGVGHVPSLEEQVSQEALDEFLSPYLNQRRTAADD